MNKRLIPSLLNEMNELDSFFNNVIPKDSFGSSGLSVYEDENHVYVEAHTPGIPSENIQVTYEKGVLWIRAEHSEEKKEVKYHTKASSKFSYRVPMPERIDESKTPEATCKDGVLKITFNKSPSSKPQKIEVKTQ